METWLKPNRRVLFVCLAPLLILVALAIWLCQAESPIRFWVGVGLLPTALLFSLMLVSRTLRRRLGYRCGNLWVDLGPGKPVSVPIDAVECFFLGSRETPVSGRWGLQSRAVSIVVRLTEKAVHYHDRAVTPSLGTWREGYITILGSWCEPISPALVAQLNKRLLAAQRQAADNVNLK
ncbi:MAG: hypothetical protein CMJ74_04785 [Planctomycetaceae bacterium]|nr:hypothetical protein [Planctomycetaceae bacterium]|tara:strand:- start:610 stop:1143 length:534 start_codon:yes stop_codon:yes gene_type:complete